MQNSEALLFCLLKHAFNEQNWCFPFIELCLALDYTAYLSLHVSCCGWLQWLQPASPSQSRQQSQGGTRKQPQECADWASSRDALTEKAPTKLIPQRPNLWSKSSSHGMTSGRAWGTITLHGSHRCTHLTQTFLKDQSMKTIQNWAQRKYVHMACQILETTITYFQQAILYLCTLQQQHPRPQHKASDQYVYLKKKNKKSCTCKLFGRTE